MTRRRDQASRAWTLNARFWPLRCRYGTSTAAVVNALSYIYFRKLTKYCKIFKYSYIFYLFIFQFVYNFIQTLRGA